MIRRLPKHFLVSLSLTLFLFFPLLWISQYNYPSGDDFRIALLAKELGAFGATKFWYFNGSGRYSFLYLQSLISYDNHWLLIYRAFPAALFLLGFGSVYYFVRSFFGEGFSPASAFTLSAILYTLLVSFTPDITTAFYWLTTNIQYVCAVFASILVFSLYINLKRTNRTLARAAYLSPIIVLILLVAGCNEASALFFLATLGAINLWQAVRFKRPRASALILLALAIGFSLMCFAAPGTQVRLSVVKADSRIFNNIAGSVALTFYLLVELLTSTPLLPASIIYLAFLQANRGRLERPRSLLLGIRWYWILLFMLLSITVVNFAIFTAIGVNSLTNRLKNIYVYTIFFGWLVMLTALFFDLSARKMSFEVPRWVLGALAFVVLGFLLTGYKLEVNSRDVIPSSSGSQRIFSVLNTRSVYANAYLDILSGRAERFARQNEEREGALLHARGDEVEFPLYSYVPQTIFLQDANHPFGAPNEMSKLMAGEVKRLHYVETGPPAPVKEKF